MVFGLGLWLGCAYLAKGKKASIVGTVLRSPMAGTARLLNESLVSLPLASMLYMPSLAIGWMSSTDMHVFHRVSKIIKLLLCI